VLFFLTPNIGEAKSLVGKASVSGLIGWRLAFALVCCIQTSSGLVGLFIQQVVLGEGWQYKTLPSHQCLPFAIITFCFSTMIAVSVAYKTCTFAGKCVCILQFEGVTKFFIPFFKHSCLTLQRNFMIYIT
jgi:hypothetical protein